MAQGSRMSRAAAMKSYAEKEAKAAKTPKEGSGAAGMKAYAKAEAKAAKEGKKTPIKGTATTTAVPAKPTNVASRDSFYNTKNYAATNKAATSLTAQQKAERGRTRERKIAKMDPISKSTVRGAGSVPVPSKNKNPGKFVR